MIYIGIVIFMVYTKSQIWIGDCANPQPSNICASIERAVQQESGRQESRYIGEFQSEAECQAAVSKATYAPKEGERVGHGWETLCVPKEPL